jgi:hypothetical protein
MTGIGTMQALAALVVALQFMGPAGRLPTTGIGPTRTPSLHGGWFNDCQAEASLQRVLR